MTITIAPNSTVNVSVTVICGPLIFSPTSSASSITFNCILLPPISSNAATFVFFMWISDVKSKGHFSQYTLTQGTSTCECVNPIWWEKRSKLYDFLSTFQLAFRKMHKYISKVQSPENMYLCFLWFGFSVDVRRRRRRRRTSVGKKRI